MVILFLFFLNSAIYLVSADIFGNDDRLLASQLDGGRAVSASAVSTMVRRHSNNLLPGGGFQFRRENEAKDNRPLCPNERFSTLNRPGEVVCGSVLIAPDLVLTARHCIDEPDISSSMCRNQFSFLFGYNQNMNQFSPEQTYSCTEILWNGMSQGVDAMVIKLDRPVVGVQPVSVRRRSTSLEGDVVTLVGPQTRLPLVASPGTIRYRDVSGGLARTVGTTMDCDVNQSGGPVFNSVGQLEGVLSTSSNPVTVADRQRDVQKTVPPVENFVPLGNTEDRLTAPPKARILPTTETPACFSQTRQADNSDRQSFAPTGEVPMINASEGRPVSPARGCTFVPIDQLPAQITNLIRDSFNRSRTHLNGLNRPHNTAQ